MTGGYVETKVIPDMVRRAAEGRRSRTASRKSLILLAVPDLRRKIACCIASGMTIVILVLISFWSPALAATHFNAFADAGIDPRPDAAVPLTGVFIDAAGSRTTLAGLGGGRPILLVPVVHKCPNICGLTLGGLMDAIDAQSFRPGRDFAFIAMGIDPRETPADAAASLGELRKRYPRLAPGAVHALTGDARGVAAAMGYRYAFDPAERQYAHVAAAAVLTPDGHLARWLYGIAPAANDVHLALAEAGQGRIGSFADRFLLLCYHYDPVTGRYDSLAMAMLQVAGGGTVAGLLAFVVLMIRREHKARRAPP